MKDSLMYKMSYYRFPELYGQGQAVDRVRQQVIPPTPIRLNTIGKPNPMGPLFFSLHSKYLLTLLCYGLGISRGSIYFGKLDRSYLPSEERGRSWARPSGCHVV